jgi:tRNA uridine 5-carboxymethylaminomethyl modification enzyme
MYQGLIEGTGPRYCPSIEDKIVRFSHNPSHHIFIEPEGLNTYEVYIQGFSSSLPADVQVAMLRTMPGLENAHVIKPAYAVEYDYVPAVQTSHSLMSKQVGGLFFAGQINGTSGYEEAAAQGLIAGINAANFVNGAEMLELNRASSYIGTLIDDLVTKDINEPYRMLTSRSEYRLLLRQDNADARLTPIGHKIGLIDDAQFKVFSDKQAAVEQALQQLNARQKQLLKRPEVTYKTLDAPELPRDVAERVEILLKYDGYIKRQEAQVEQSGKLENFRIPDNIDYEQIKHISTETRDKLIKIRPKTLAQASRIGGVKPADISVLMVLLDKK